MMVMVEIIMVVLVKTIWDRMWGCKTRMIIIIIILNKNLQRQTVWWRTWSALGSSRQPSSGLNLNFVVPTKRK